MMDGAALRSLLIGLVILAGLQLSSCSIYVRRGDNITDCSMKCRHRKDILQMYRKCGGDEAPLQELWCNDTRHYNQYGPRLHLDPSSGCWTLRNATKNDSCLYNVVYYGDNGRFVKKIPITVLDPVFISTITSNSSRPDEDIAVTVQFSGEEAAVTWEVDGGLLPARYRLRDDNRTVIIPRDDAGRRLRVRITNPVSDETREYQLEITDPAYSGLVSVPRGYVALGIVFLVVAACIALLVTCRCHKKTETEDVERRTEENGGQTSSSQTDRPGAEEAGSGENSFLIRIREIWGQIWRKRVYEETRQRDEVEMEVVRSVAVA